jgi:spore coat polysaccharide biosynthesis protein SpsF
MRRVLIVQARMTSTRLPGKVLMDLAGAPMLQRQIERLRRCDSVDEIVLATTTNDTDDPVAVLADELGVGCFRGSESDVLGRYAGAARESGADLVVRVTADCPLIDPAEVDVVIDALTDRRGACDYAANIIDRRLPRGLDTEALWRDVLERIDRLATSPPAREHVTYYCHGERPDLFLLHSVARPFDAADLRWTVDQPEDLEMVRRLDEATDQVAHPLGAEALIAYVRAHPEIAAINAEVAQKDHTA